MLAEIVLVFFSAVTSAPRDAVEVGPLATAPDVPDRGALDLYPG